MTPDRIPTALRDFAAAAGQSPDPARSVSELALLLAALWDEMLAFAGSMTMDKLAARVADHAIQLKLADHDELAFPPVDDLADPLPTPQQVAAAQLVSGKTPEQWEQMGDIERWHALNVAEQLKARVESVPGGRLVELDGYTTFVGN